MINILRCLFSNYINYYSQSIISYKQSLKKKHLLITINFIIFHFYFNNQIVDIYQPRRHKCQRLRIETLKQL
ncbi:hypothetical protein pb186bvf_020687 [Paramecium bursaria]